MKRAAALLPYPDACGEFAPKASFNKDVGGGNKAGSFQNPCQDYFMAHLALSSRLI